MTDVRVQFRTFSWCSVAGFLCNALLSSERSVAHKEVSEPDALYQDKLSDAVASHFGS
jgi:hypothetical protein